LVGDFEGEEFGLESECAQSLGVEIGLGAGLFSVAQ